MKLKDNLKMKLKG